MGLYINNKEKFLALCEEFFDNGKDFAVIGFDNNDNLRIDVNVNATEKTIGHLLFGASYCKLFGCGLNYYEDLLNNQNK